MDHVAAARRLLDEVAVAPDRGAVVGAAAVAVAGARSAGRRRSDALKVRATVLGVAVGGVAEEVQRRARERRKARELALRADSGRQPRARVGVEHGDVHPERRPLDLVLDHRQPRDPRHERAVEVRPAARRDEREVDVVAVAAAAPLRRRNGRVLVDPAVDAAARGRAGRAWRRDGTLFSPAAHWNHGVTHWTGMWKQHMALAERAEPRRESSRPVAARPRVCARVRGGRRGVARRGARREPARGCAEEARARVGGDAPEVRCA